MKKLFLVTTLLGLALLAPGALRAQTVYSQGATGANGSAGSNGVGGGGGNGSPALDLSGSASVISGTYQGGNGGSGGSGTMGVFMTFPVPSMGPGGAGGSGGNGGSALVAESGATINITGGMFFSGLAGSGGAGGPGTPTGSAGSAGNAGYSLLDNGGTITLFGNFTGGPRTLAAGTGTFTGMLQNETSAQTFTYNLVGGTITLAVPEPSAWAAVAAGAGLLGLVTRRRRVRRA